jgi:hypothetical protein
MPAVEVMAPPPRSRRGRWLAAAIAAAIVAGLGVVFVADWRAAVEGVVALGWVVAAVCLIVWDSDARGRSGGWWLFACALLAPIGLPVFVVVGVLDRLRGRLGIEARLAPVARWCLLGVVVLAVPGIVHAESQVRVPGVSVSVPGASGSFSGSCSSALDVFLGNGAYSHSFYGPAGAPPVQASTPPVLTNAWATVAGRCSAVAASRMTGSAICMGGALLFALTGWAMNRRRRSRLRPGA